jgi:hypothetical protein
MSGYGHACTVTLLGHMMWGANGAGPGKHGPSGQDRRSGWRAEDHGRGWPGGPPGQAPRAALLSNGGARSATTTTLTC